VLLLFLVQTNVCASYSLLMQAVSTHIPTDMLARAMETVLNNDEINVARCKEWEYFHWDKTQQILM